MNIFFANYDFRPCFASQDVDYIWSYLKNAICCAIKMFVPRFHLKSKQQPKWFTSSIRHNLNRTRSFRKAYRNAPTQTNRNKLEEAEKKLQILMKEAKLNYEATLVQQFSYSNNSRIFQYISSLKKQSTLPLTMSFNNSNANSDYDKAELFNDYFFSVFTALTPTQSQIQTQMICTQSTI